LTWVVTQRGDILLLSHLTQLSSGEDALKFSDNDLFSPDLKITQYDHLHDTSSSLLPMIAPTEEADEISQQQPADESFDEFDPYYFIFSLPPHSSVIQHGKICLPPPVFHHRRTLVLDLDETLVHCTVEPTCKSDFTFPVNYNSTDYEVYVRKRPYVDYFLESVSKEFEVIVFTASQQVYADRLLDYLDPNKKYFASRLFREACLDVYGNFIKDLSVLNRDLSKVLVPDSVASHSLSFFHLCLSLSLSVCLCLSLSDDHCLIDCAG
jgi:Dullard-like phosphatase family protein